MNCNTDEFDAESGNTRKPLVFILPALDSTEEFDDSLKDKLVAKTLPFKFDLLHPSATQSENTIKKWLSFTPTAQKRTKIDMIKIQKPSTFENENSLSPSFEEEMINIELKEEQKSSEEGKFQVKLTKEIEDNFKQLPEIGFIPMEEIVKKFINLPVMPGKQSNKVLFLDLDDTLIHTMNPKLNYKAIKINPNDVKAIMYSDAFSKSVISVKTIIRPFLSVFLKELKPIYEIGVFIL